MAFKILNLYKLKPFKITLIATALKQDNLFY